MAMLRRTTFPENHHFVPDPAWTRSAFTVLRAGRVVAAPDYRIERAGYPGQDVLFCHAGRGFAWSEGGMLAVGANQLVWIANEAPHAHWPDAADPWTLSWVRLDGPDPAALRRRIFGAGPTVTTLAPAVPVAAWFARLFGTLRTRAADVDLALNHLVAEFLHLLAARAPNPEEQRLPAPLRAALAQMASAPERAWRADHIAAVAGLSAGQTRRLFQRHLRLSPRQWLARERIMRAQSLLLETGLSVSAVAELCGFCDVYHFSREFRRRVGISPRSWRHAEGGSHGMR
jgi:AraC-like DNA-binding protein